MLSDEQIVPLFLNIDTITLKFPYTKPNNDFFNERIHKKELNLEYIAGNRYVWTNNRRRKELIAQGLYMPKYWIEQDFINPAITYFLIELSVGKFLNGENISAIRETNLTPLVKKISLFCRSLGINIWEYQILRTIPKVLAVGANLNITNLFFCEDVIEALMKFDYKPYCKQRVNFFLDLKGAGREIIFSIPKTETFKIYSKNREIINNAKTTEEKQIAGQLKIDRYKQNQVYINEILRPELTMKTSQKIRERLKPYLGKAEPTLENVFKPYIWEGLLKEEINRIYNHPLKNFVFLALEQEPFIEAFLDQNYKHIETKDTIRGIILSLQRKGIARTREDYLKKYKSRQTWYNYLERLKKLANYFDIKAIANLKSFQIHSFILKQFGIDNRQQGQFNFNSNMSKKIDAKRRNTKEIYD